MGLILAGGIALQDHASAGAAGAPLLLVHGAGGTHLHWPPELRELPGRRVLSVDLPGHGRSPPPGERTIEGYARALLRMLDELGIPRVAVAGHSMGGAIALTLALEAPERVAALVLVGTGARLRVAPVVLAGAADPARAVEVGEQVAGLAFGPGAPGEAVAAHARGMAEQAPGIVHGDFSACDAFDVIARLPEIEAAAFLVVGSDDRLTPPKYAEFLRGRLPGEGMLVVPGAGHMVALEAPAVVAGAVRGFLDGRAP